MNWSDVPRADLRSPEAPPRAVRFRDVGGVDAVGRRGFFAVLATGAMTLGMTLLGWIPLARPARAQEGSEYLSCGGYSDGPGGPLCVGAPYSADYCGDDEWFRNGCFFSDSGGDSDEDAMECYEPFASCYAEGNEARDAWRWEAEGTTYRCADGRIHHAGTPNPEFVICSATLSTESSPEEQPALPRLPLLP